jgi:uncharacterized protein DUF6600
MKTTFTGISKVRLLLCLTGLLCFFFASPNVRADEGDPPSRVARISFIDGTVSFQPGGMGDWGTAARNRTVTVGDKIWADKDSRAELQAGQATIHVGSMTALSFLNLDENITQMRLAEGALNFRVRELREGDLYEVDTPNLAFTVKQAGDFRIDVNENGDGTRITAIRGEGEVTASGKTYAVHAGERAEFNGTDNVEYTVSQAAGPDGLDRWADERDLKEDNSTSARYVSRDVPGYSDLDDNGTWSEQPDYGPVWYPNSVSVGWAPYSSGYWNWVGPWGWTWVDYEPWGFAPFHYGRWAFIGSRWGWCPGPFFGRPVFGPAFVGFFGGSRFGVGFGFGGGVGWFPLGFGEPFFPGFHCGRGFVERINVRNTFIRNTNILNTTNVHNFNFVNAHNVNAVTVASHSAFVNGQAINRGSVRLTAASLKGAQVTNSVGLSPTRRSSIGAVNAGAHVSTPPSAVQNRSVMARTAPAAAASHMPVHTMNTTGLSVGRMGNAPHNNVRVNSGISARENQISQNKPPSANGGLANRATLNPPSNNIRVNSGMSARENQISQNKPPSANGGLANRATLNAPSNNIRVNSGMSGRQNQLSQNRPPSANGGISNRTSLNATTNGASQNRPTNGMRTWEAQGNATDRGHAPQGFGRSSSAPVNGTPQGAHMNRSDRPAWAGSSSNGPANSGSRSASPSFNSNRPSYSNGGRSYEPPSRSSSSPSRTYSAPRSSYPSSPRSYSVPSPSYSAPSRSYSAPSRSYSAPSPSYSPPSRPSGGGSPRGGGGSPRGGGGTPHTSRH